MTSAKTETLSAALVQMRTGLDVAANTEAAIALVREAARSGARYVQTPETTNIMDLDRKRLFSIIVPEEEDPTLAALRQVARELGIFLHIGSLVVRASPQRGANRAFLIRPDGTIAARYDKIHMFGYDLRFPALYRALAEAGARVLTVPAAFTRPTGEAHWHVLLRARAIENGAYVLAAAQGGRHENGRDTYGHSLVVDPWGRVIAEGGTDPGVILAELDMGEVGAARGRIPSLRHGRRFEVAPPPESGHLHLVEQPS